MFRPGPSPLRFRCLAHDIEPQPRALDRVHTFVRAEKPLEQFLTLVGGHPDAVVAHADDDLPLPGFSLLFRARDLDESLSLSAIRVLDRVGEIILDTELDDSRTDLDI